MIDAILKGALQNRLVVLTLAVACIVWGAVEIPRMPVDVFPDLTAPTVTVVTEAHGMAPEEVEQLVTFPIESAVAGAPDVRRVRSASSVGFSVVYVEFDWGADVFLSRQLVAEKLQLVQPTLPAEVEPPVLAPVTSVMGEIVFVAMTSETTSPRDLRTIADRDVRRRLMAIPGVAQVVPIGGRVHQIQVVVRPPDLATHGVTLDEVADAVAESNENASAGFHEVNGQESLIYTLGRAESLDEIADSVIGPREHGIPLRVRDVADVRIGDAIARGDGAFDTDPAVVLVVRKQPGANTLELTGRIDEVLDSLDRELPEGVMIHRDLPRQADFIENGVDNVAHALRDGALLVVLIIGVFLVSSRATFITALAIPLSLVVAAMVLHAMGATLNTMSLGGMAIAVGALVDDAIIDVENVVRRLREKQPTSFADRLQVVFDASREVRGSIVFATFIIVLVFAPLFALHGVEGRMLAPLGIAYVVSLLASLVVALTVTPVLCLMLLPRSRAVSRGDTPWLVRTLERLYRPVLERIVGAWPALLVASGVAVVIAGSFGVRAGRAFLPAFNEGALTVSVVTIAGTSLDASNELGQRVERILLTHPEVIATGRRTGRAELDEHSQGVHASEIEVTLQMGERSEAEMLAAMREDLTDIAGANIVIGQPISHRIDHMLSGTRANIAVKIFGPDLDELDRIATEVEAAMQGVDGVVDLSIEEATLTPMTTVDLDRAALASHELRVHEVAEALETAFYGRTVSRVFDGTFAYDLVVRFPRRAWEDIDALRDTRIATPSGAWVPLQALAAVRPDRGPTQIARENGQRKRVVMCNVGGGRDLGTVVAEVQATIAEQVDLPPGYRVEYGGQFEAAEAAARTLSLVGAGVIAGILVLLIAALTSMRDAVVVMLNLPLALIGGVAGVYVSGGVISVASLIGFITLFGIATRNGIMMISHVRHLAYDEGHGAREAVLRGATERLTPILMTALATALGLLPLALALGQPGSEIQAPMAIVILCGLVSSTALNMVVVPAMMLRFGSVHGHPGEDRMPGNGAA